MDYTELRTRHDAIKKAKEAVKSRFSAHSVGVEGRDKMALIRRNVRGMASAIDMLCPESLEKEQALIALQTVMMFANSAIAQTYPVDREEQP